MSQPTTRPASLKQQTDSPFPQTPESIDFRELPSSAGFSQLFLDYINEYDLLGDFFPGDFRKEPTFRAVISAMGPRRFDRARLASILERQNTEYRSGALSVANARLLGGEKCYAVVTGQQVGMFGGPLYTVYKIVTCLNLTGALKKRYPDCEFVPVFWLEGEDHDFGEVSRVTILDRGGVPVPVEYPTDSRTEGKNPGPVGELRLGAAVEEVMKSLEAALLPTEFTRALLEELRNAYSGDRTFLEAFVRWTIFLFGDSGLVFLNPNDPDLKRGLAPIFEQEIEQFPRTSQAVIQRSAELEERYHAQVKPKSINLFLLHRGGRYLIEPREHDFSLKGTRHFISREEMSRLLRDHPASFSPNVILRPIAQDFLLPTIAYVGGPSEVAYHAQLGPVYDQFGVTRPVVYPRASASFVEERAERALRKHQLPITQLFEDSDAVTERILRQVDGVNVEALFRTADDTIAAMFTELHFGLSEIDPTLKGPLDASKSKIEQALRVLQEKSVAAQKRRNETVVRQIEGAIASMMPGGILQERGLNLIYYLNKYGPETIRWLTGELKADLFKHQLLTF